jgi:dCMP deaminase
MSEIDTNTSFVRWDDYYLKMLDSIRTKSKDPSTKVGAIIVNQNNKIVSTGFNGFAIGVCDNEPSRYERPIKYDYTIHAELNAILLHARSGGSPLEGCRLYCSLHPCAACANAIAQAGIKEVIAYLPPPEMSERLAKDFKFDIARTIFAEADVGLVLIEKE